MIMMQYAERPIFLIGCAQFGLGPAVKILAATFRDLMSLLQGFIAIFWTTRTKMKQRYSCTPRSTV
jgi:hypothetical protein